MTRPFAATAYSDEVQTIADLRDLSVPTARAVVHVSGYYVSLDGGGGDFYWDASSTLDDDGGFAIKPTAVLISDPGRWIRLLPLTHLDPRWWGAKDDATLTFDSYPSMQALLDYVDRVYGVVSYPLGLRVDFPQGNFWSSGTWNVNRPLFLKGQGRVNTLCTFKDGGGGSIGGIRFNCTDDIPGAPIAYDASHSRLQGMGVFGNANYSFLTPHDPLMAEYDPLITEGSTFKSFDGVGISIIAHGVVVDDVFVAGFEKDGICVASTGSKNSNGWTVRDYFSTSNGRHSLFVTGDNGNAGSARGCDLNAGQGWGIYDRSFLANHYDANQTAENGVWIRDVYALHVDPNRYRGGKLYGLIAGGRQGGTYLTADYSSWWTQNIGLQNYGDTNEKSLRLAAINALADDGVKLFAGSGAVNAGFGGGGVYRKALTTGTTWEQANNGLSDTDVRALACSVDAAGTLLAGTNGSGVFKTVDSGDNWAASNTGLTNHVVLSLVNDPDNASHYFAGTAAGVFYSTDSGATWASVGLGTLTIYSLAMVGGILLAGADDGTVQKSTNNGTSWTPATKSGTSVVQCLAIDPNDTTKCYAGTHSDGMYVSSDSGDNFAQSNTGLDDVQQSAPIRDVRCLVVGEDGLVFAGVKGNHYVPDNHNNGGVYKSTDNGATWDPTIGQSLRYGGGYFSVENSIAPNTFVGCYAEGDQNEWVQQPSTIIGGVLAFEAQPFPGSNPAIISPQVGGVVGLPITGNLKTLISIIPDTVTGLNTLSHEYADVTDYYMNPGGIYQTAVLNNPASFPGTTLFFKKTNSSIYAAIVNGQIEDGLRSLFLWNFGDYVYLKSDGVKWRIIGEQGVNCYTANEALLPYIAPDSAAWGWTPNFTGNYIVSAYYRVSGGPVDFKITLAWSDAGGAQTKEMVNVVAQPDGSYTLDPVVINSVEGVEVIMYVTESAANKVYLSASIKKV